MSHRMRLAFQHLNDYCSTEIKTTFPAGVPFVLVLFDSSQDTKEFDGDHVAADILWSAPVTSSELMWLNKNAPPVITILIGANCLHLFTIPSHGWFLATWNTHMMFKTGESPSPRDGEWPLTWDIMGLEKWHIWSGNDSFSGSLDFNLPEGNHVWSKHTHTHIYINRYMQIYAVSLEKKDMFHKVNHIVNHPQLWGFGFCIR